MNFIIRVYLDYEDFLLGEVRYSALVKKDQEKSKILFEKAKNDAKAKREELEKIKRMCEWKN